MDGSSRYRESEEYYNRGRSSDKVVELGEFLFPGSYCDRGNVGQTKAINEQIKSHSTPRNEIASCIQFTSAAMENPSIADLEMLQSVNSFSELLSGNAYLGSDLQVALCKELTKSDVGNTGRIVLPKREAEACLPPLSEREGIVLHMEDMTLQCSWKFKYRFWPNNRSRMYILENTGDFVRAHCLQTGDSLIIYRNSTSGNFFVRGKKANPQQSPMDLVKFNWKNQFSTDEEHCSSSMYDK
ncbi:hypothetical protein ZIOFF_003148 [Zingiber officinale]|uniref:TF-B3 domain-containing protein n=1 Tax=Zingiber officinale TaxID=94328 RepID=A0A8J5ICS2_ZINOF|nr:hypothetical protein ZIOFF_003148 [Zingiber officinale]